MDLPIYNITFDPNTFESGIDMIAITEDPAIEMFALKFKSENPIRFRFDKEKRILAGPVAIPNKPIYRKDENGKEYYVVFSAETIELMAEKFNYEQRSIKFNMEHDESRLVEGFVKGSWMVDDPANDKSRYYGFDNLEKGTFFIEAKITDEKAWDVIKDKEYVGFSLEGLLGVEKLEFKSIELETNINQKEMSKTKKLKFLANRAFAKKKFNTSTRKFEQVIEISDESDILLVEGALETGAAIEIVTEEGVVEPAPSGDYEIVSGDVPMMITVEDGTVATVEEGAEEMTEEVEEEMASEETATETATETTEEMASEEEMEYVTDPEVITRMVELESRIEALEAMLAEEETEEVFSKAKKVSKFKNQSVAEKLQVIKSLK